MWLLESGHLHCEDEERDHFPSPDLEPPDEEEPERGDQFGYDTSDEWQMDHPGRRYNLRGLA